MLDVLLNPSQASEDFFIFTIVSFIILVLQRISKRIFIHIEEKYVAQILSIVLIFLIKRLKKRMHKHPQIIHHAESAHDELHKLQNSLKGDKIILG